MTSSLLGGAKLTSIYADWLRPREAKLRAGLRAIPTLPPTRILLLNATKGPHLFPSIADFFAVVSRIHPEVRVTSSSYFDEIFDLAAGVAKKGLEVVPVSRVRSWTLAELNRFDVVIAVGPSEALAELVSKEGFTARLVCLDLAFYHQLIEGSGGAFLRGEPACPPRGPHANPVVCYSCQPEEKVVDDLTRAGWLPARPQPRTAWRFRWFPYIPIGFSYQSYYASDRAVFDVALLGTSGRSYGDIDPEALRGRRVLFIGRAENDPDLEQLRAEVAMTVVSGLTEDAYARLLATCRCVVLPCRGGVIRNVFFSVVDALASGKPLVTSRHPGIERLVRTEAPLELYASVEAPSSGPPSLRSVAIDRNLGALARMQTQVRLSAAIDRALRDETRARATATRAIAFAKEHLDIYRVLETILRDEVVNGQAARARADAR